MMPELLQTVIAMSHQQEEVSDAIITMCSFGQRVGLPILQVQPSCHRLYFVDNQVGNSIGQHARLAGVSAPQPMEHFTELSTRSRSTSDGPPCIGVSVGTSPPFLRARAFEPFAQPVRDLNELLSLATYNKSLSTVQIQMANSVEHTLMLVVFNYTSF